MKIRKPKPYQCGLDCKFKTRKLRKYYDHLYEAHTEDEPGTDRQQTVYRILFQQGHGPDPDKVQHQNHV